MHPFQVCKSITWLGTGQPTHGQDQGLIGEERGVEGVSLWQSMIGYIPHDLTSNSQQANIIHLAHPVSNCSRAVTLLVDPLFDLPLSPRPPRSP